MTMKGYALCICVVAVLLSAAAQFTDFKKNEELAMPLRTFLPRWYMHSCGLNRECLAVHQQQHNPEGTFYAQDEEDEAAEHEYFNGTHAGIFVELGATDGELFSNTKFFEDHRGWRVSLGVKSNVHFLSAVVLTSKCHHRCPRWRARLREQNARQQHVHIGSMGRASGSHHLSLQSHTVVGRDYSPVLCRVS